MHFMPRTGQLRVVGAPEVNTLAERDNVLGDLDHQHAETRTTSSPVVQSPASMQDGSCAQSPTSRRALRMAEAQAAAAVAKRARPNLTAKRKKVKQRAFSAAVMSFAFALVATMALPAYAFNPEGDVAVQLQASTSQELRSDAAQSFTVADTVAIDRVSRDKISATTEKELTAMKAAKAAAKAERAAEAAAAEAAEAAEAAAAEQSSWSMASAPMPASNGMVQAPVPMGSISEGYGPRIAPCSGCSTFHDGLDITPGRGTPVRAIANGVVSTVSSNGTLGVHVAIDHEIDGHSVQSVYGHMAPGSIQVSVGQSVSIGQQIGNVGSTGQSTGPHLHLEIFVDGTATDPASWLARMGA